MALEREADYPACRRAEQEASGLCAFRKGAHTGSRFPVGEGTKAITRLTLAANAAFRAGDGHGTGVDAHHDSERRCAH